MILHPGGTELTEEAARLAGFKKGDKILDVGCGDGSGMSFLAGLGLEMTGCDVSKEMVKRAREAGLDVIETDGLEIDLPSLSFDGAIAECSLSLMDRHGELFHELYCLLKKGARLVITDLYDRMPDPARVEANRVEALKYLNTRREEGQCGDISAPSPVRLDGLFIAEELIIMLEETGFSVKLFSDKTKCLLDFGAQILMDFGSFEKWAESVPGDCVFCKTKPGKNAGYFLLVAEKK